MQVSRTLLKRRFKLNTFKSRNIFALQTYHKSVAVFLSIQAELRFTFKSYFWIYISGCCTVKPFIFLAQIELKKPFNFKFLFSFLKIYFKSFKFEFLWIQFYYFNNCCFLILIEWKSNQTYKHKQGVQFVKFIKIKWFFLY